ncbi:MAG: hypothetical protein N3F67_01375 [Acidilobaceae archaeon]|nr:hypothetical protein [Acidilobaceae archaeon]
MAKALAKVVGGKALLECLDAEFCRGLERHGYLNDGELEPLELAYQLSQESVELEGLKGWEALLWALRELSISFGLFLTYQDLRKKGRAPRRGARRDSLLVQLPSGKIGEVLVLEEGDEKSLEELADWVKSVQALEHVPIVAVVDKAGVISYYEARAFRKLS